MSVVTPVGQTQHNQMVTGLTFLLTLGSAFWVVMVMLAKSEVAKQKKE